MVSNTEATEEQPDKNLCRDVCAERVRRVMAGYTTPDGEAVAGLGAGFAYLRARRIPPHRLGHKIAHAEVWTALELLHGLPLSPWPGGGFAGHGAMAYLADFGDESLAALDAWRRHDPPPAPVLYCWAPERLRGAAEGLELRPIPQSLRERFGR